MRSRTASVELGEQGDEVQPFGGRATVLQLVFYRRESQWRHVAAGRMLAWARRPWLALTLTSRFHQP
jgi:hypothetical protein